MVHPLIGAHPIRVLSRTPPPRGWERPRWVIGRRVNSTPNFEKEGETFKKMSKFQSDRLPNPIPQVAFYACSEMDGGDLSRGFVPKWWILAAITETEARRGSLCLRPLDMGNGIYRINLGNSVHLDTPQGANILHRGGTKESSAAISRCRQKNMPHLLLHTRYFARLGIAIVLRPQAIHHLRV
jgi:hypothetical protein